MWNLGLTKSQVKDLEKIQKCALKIILKDGYNSYELACDFSNKTYLQNTLIMH